MNKPKVNTDKVITNTKKALYDLRDIDHDAMSKEEKEDFKQELTEVEQLAKEVLDKIKNA